MKKSKVILFAFILTLNLLLVKICKIKIIFEEVLIIQAFLFSLSFLADIIQQKLTKHKNTTPAHFLTINFARILLCVVFLFPTILQYSKTNNSYIYNFVIIYFIYLFHDIIFKAKSFNKINV